MNKIYSKWLKIKDEEIINELKQMKQEQIDFNFSGSLEFGTAGLRGIMEIGSNRMNNVNICKLANAILILYKKNNFKSIVIGYDTRHNSKEFAQVFARVFSLGGIKVKMFNNFIPTPIAVFAIAETKCDMGIMITASHNNKIYNGVKVSGRDGIQISGEIEKELGKLYSEIDEVELYNQYYQTLGQELTNIEILGEEIVNSFIGKITKNENYGNLNIIYTPLNGTACEFVLKVLKERGFNNIVIPNSQKEANGNFITCPYPNPEFEETFAECKKITESFDADVIVATDPDGDRLGAMIKTSNGYKLLTGNEVGFLLLNYIYENKNKNNKLFASSTVVSSPLFFNMCDEYGIEYKRTLTGFKNIGKAKKELESKFGNNGFTISYEESCGYIVKNNLYDKDGIFALLKFCEMASDLKRKGSSIEEHLNNIYSNFGNLYSLNSSIAFNGENALERMNQSIENLRTIGLNTIMGRNIIQTVDYLNDNTGLPKSNFIEFKTKEVSFIIRPSGTEPKLKFYIHAKGKTLNESKQLAVDVLNAIKKEIFEINE